MTLREKVARALAEFQGEIHEGTWKFYLRDADAAIALVLEEAAQLCCYQNEYDDPVAAHAELMTCARIAAAIRAMKENPLPAEARDE